ncbi:MAG: hypothetical protein H6822_31730 [Planctomycetaceae bacterium]|nr:hypothetical protein [Planctomycetales bacterium]MCB9926753.1 hypothetical protein [Planctomycetaceae bacterium]
MNQGKLIIVFIFGLSAVMGGYAWWHHYTQGRRCVEFWGAKNGESIRYSPRVEVLKLTPAVTTDADLVQIGDDSYSIVCQRDITATPGLVHARQALIEDASYIWEAEINGHDDWHYVLQFTDDQKQVRVAFDSGKGRVRLVGTDQIATLKPHLATAYQTRLPQWLGDDTNSSLSDEVTTADMP